MASEFFCGECRKTKPIEQFGRRITVGAHKRMTCIACHTDREKRMAEIRAKARGKK